LICSTAGLCPKDCVEWRRDHTGQYRNVRPRRLLGTPSLRRNMNHHKACLRNFVRVDRERSDGTMPMVSF